MFIKPFVFVFLNGIAIGLFVGITDSSLHFMNLENYKILNIILFILLFLAVYGSIIVLRDKICDGIISYGGAFRNILFTGIIAAAVIGFTRFIYLSYIVNIDIDSILNQTKETMLNKYSLYTTEQIDNRLSFIEFSYNPIISSILYFTYYLIFVIIFALFASFLIKRIDRNISL